MSSVYHEENNRFIFLNTRGQWYSLDTLSVPIGFGAIGIVYIGYNVVSHSPVAIKLVRPEFSGNPFIRERARAEAQLTFLHPHIVRMLGLCEDTVENGNIYLISEFVNGLTFDSYCKNIIDRSIRRNWIAQILRISIDILDALGYVHSAGVIHRDVKPSNIMVSYDGVPKLMDLGIAGIFNSESVEDHGFMGTALYAAPELINKGIIDKRTDLYAMGVTIFEMIAGYNPFKASTQEEILQLHLKCGLPEEDTIPRNLMSILRRSTERNKQKRYQFAKSFADDLKSFLSDYASNPV